MRWVTVASEEGPRACGVFNGQYVDVNAADPEMPATVRGLLELGPDWQRRAWAALPRRGRPPRSGPRRSCWRRCPMLARSSASA